MSSQKPEVLSFGTAASTKIPRYELIPKAALMSLASRFEKGIERHAEKAWNALSPNYESALTKEWVTARLAHAIDHAYNALLKLQNGIDDGEDDAGALMFAGAVLAVYKTLMQPATLMHPERSLDDWNKIHSKVVALHPDWDSLSNHDKVVAFLKELYK
jgi:hypothetical protein